GSIIYREASLVLLAANSHVLVGNTGGIQKISINEYWDMDIKDKEGDLIIQLITEKRYLNLPHAHVKRTKNEKIAYPLISAVALKDEENINIAFSGICDTSFRSKKIEENLNNISISPDKRINDTIEKITYKILDDNNGTPEYRKFVLANILEEIIDKFEGGDALA